MFRKLALLLLIVSAIPAQAQTKIEQWLVNRTFSVHDADRNIRYRQFFSDRGLTYATTPNDKAYKEGHWQIQSDKICIEWIRPASQDCYTIERTAEQIRLYKSAEADSPTAAITLTDPQYGNQFYQLLANRIEYALAGGVNTRLFGININTRNSAVLIDSLTISPALLFKTSYNYFTPQARFGWYIEAGMSYFDVEEHCGLWCIFGTQDSYAQGYYAYLMPTLYLSITNPVKKNRHNGQWLFGIGAGPSYLHGDAFLDGIYSDNRDDEYIKYSMYGYMYNIFFDYNLKLLKIRIAITGSKYKKDDLSIEIDDIGGQVYLSLYF